MEKSTPRATPPPDPLDLRQRGRDVGLHILFDAFGGQVGIAGHLTVGDRVKIASKSGVSNSIPEGETYRGSPAMPGIKYHRSHAVFRNLPDLSYKVRQLEKELAKLRERLGEAEQ